MNSPIRTVFGFLLFSMLIGTLTPASAHIRGSTHPQRVVIQVSDANPGKWNLALNNAKNVQQALGAKNVQVQIVAYGPGLPMLKWTSVVGTRVARAVQSGVTVVACGVTMRRMHLTKSDMLPNLVYVPSGVPYIMKLQQEGYSYIRP
ncbi:MAG TPA: DsrE family protein [Acidiferrobacteraceae bacterium]|nr:DsrE family protein [Acidiferrobacteraceae bacterium]